MGRVPSWHSGTDSISNAENSRDPGLIPEFRRSLEEGNGNPLPVYLPGESHGQRSLVGYGPQSGKESGITEHKGTRLHSTHFYGVLAHYPK